MSGDASVILIASNSSDCDCDLRTFTKSFIRSAPLRSCHGRGAIAPRGPSFIEAPFGPPQLSSSISMPSERISFTNTLKDSGMPACMV